MIITNIELSQNIHLESREKPEKLSSTSKATQAKVKSKLNDLGDKSSTLAFTVKGN